MERSYREDVRRQLPCTYARAARTPNVSVVVYFDEAEVMIFDYFKGNDQFAFTAIIVGLATTALLVIGSLAEAGATFLKQLGRLYYDVKQTFRELRQADLAHANRLERGPNRTGQISTEDTGDKNDPKEHRSAEYAQADSFPSQAEIPSKSKFLVARPPSQFVETSRG